MTDLRGPIYARVSRVQGDREVAGSVAQQLDACRRLARERGITVTEELTEEISAYSGAPRPAFDALCERVASGTVNHVIAYSPERIVRRPVDLERYVKACEPHGVLTSTVVAGSSPLDLSNPTGLVVARISVALASYEVDQLRDRVRRGIAARSAQGLPSGGRVPFGFLPDRVTHNPVEAEAIRAGTDAILSGESVRSIARAWNDAGLRTRTGLHFTPTQVRTILMRPRNAGLVQRKGSPGRRASWAPIIPVDRWEALCALIPTRRTTPGNQPSWLLSFIARCECGEFLKSWRSGYDRHGKTRVSYRCTVMGRTEPHPTVPASALDEYVTEKLITGYLEQGFGFPSTEVYATPDTSVSERDDIQRRRSFLVSEFAAGRLSEDEYRVAMDSLQLRDEQAGSPRLVTVLSGAESLEALYAEWGKFGIDRKRDIVRDTVDVTIHRVGAGNRVPLSERVTLTWKFDTFAT